MFSKCDKLELKFYKINKGHNFISFIVMKS